MLSNRASTSSFSLLKQSLRITSKTSNWSICTTIGSTSAKIHFSADFGFEVSRILYKNINNNFIFMNLEITSAILKKNKHVIQTLLSHSLYWKINEGLTCVHKVRHEINGSSLIFQFEQILQQPLKVRQNKYSLSLLWIHFKEIVCEKFR